MQEANKGEEQEDRQKKKTIEEQKTKEREDEKNIQIIDEKEKAMEKNFSELVQNDSRKKNQSYKIKLFIERIRT